MNERLNSQFSELPLAPGQDFDLKELLRGFWRHKGLIAGTIILLMGATKVFLTQRTPLYTAEATVLFEPNPQNDTVVKLSTLEDNPPSPEEVTLINTEAEVLSSRDLAFKVINDLNLKFEQPPLNPLRKIFARASRVPPSPTPLVHFKFDENSGTVVANSSGTGKNASFLGTPTHSKGQIGNAVGFYSGDDYVQLHNPIRPPNNKSYTYAFWFKADAAASDVQGLVGEINNPRITWMVDRTIQFDHAYADGAWAGGVSSPALNVGQWYHVAAVASDASSSSPTVKLYIDGTEVASHTFAKPLRRPADTHYVNNRDNLHLFRGLVDELRIYNEALTPNEVQILAQEPDQQTTQTDQFLSRLEVFQKGDAYVVTVKFTAENPTLAARVANKLVEVYIADRLAISAETIRRASAWLEKSVAKLQQDGHAAEKALHDFRKTTGLLENTAFSKQQLDQLDDELIRAQTTRAGSEARLRRARELLQTQKGVIFAAEVLQSPLLQRLREEKMLSERKLAEFNRKYQLSHPDTELLHKQIQDLETAIKSEVQAIIKGFEDEVAVTRAREEELQIRVLEAKERVVGTNTQLLDLQQLEGEAEAKRSLLQIFLARLAETNSNIGPGNLRPAARIISHADVPLAPSFPNHQMILKAALVGSTFFAFLLAFIVEQLEPGFRSSDEVEQHTGVRVLALIPFNEVVSNGDTSPLSSVTKRASPMFAESMRNLYVVLHIMNADAAKTVLITSAEPNEGKTTIASCLATVQALAGRKSIVVDTDFRKPNVHAVFGVPLQPGLVEYLKGTASLDEVCHTDAESGVTVIPGGAGKPNSLALLASDQLDKLLNTLSQRFDNIVLDSPPLMAVPDARILSVKADATIFVVRWAKTKREVVTLAIEQIGTSVQNFGVVLSMVNRKKHAQYGSADSAYYSKKIESYYVGRV